MYAFFDQKVDTSKVSRGHEIVIKTCRVYIIFERRINVDKPYSAYIINVRPTAHW